MTMHVYFEKDKDGYKKGFSGYVERSLARRFCENGIAIPYQTHLDNVYDVEQIAKKADEQKKADLLKEKEKPKTEKADSKKPKKAEKSVKK